MMTLRAKADETTKHIQSLVSKQKVNNKNKYAVYRQKRNGQRTSQYSGQQHQRNRPQTNPAPAPPMVPAYLRNQIQDLFKSFPNGLGIMQFDGAFGRIYGTRINFSNYGFPNLFELLKSMPDIVRVQLVNRSEWIVVPVTTKTSHVSPAVKSGTNVPTQEKRPPGVQQYSDFSDGNQKRPSRGRGICSKSVSNCERCSQPWFNKILMTTGCLRNENIYFLKV